MASDTQSERPIRAALTRVAVLGAGLMGHAIAYAIAAHGRPVRVYDSAEAMLVSLPERFAACAQALGGPTVNCFATTDLREAVIDADLVIEAVPEDLVLKGQLLSRVHQLQPRALLATNTSVIPIADVAAKLPTTAELVGTHWWNPPHLIDIVEIVAGPHVSAASVTAVQDLLIGCGKQPVLVADVPGFVGNRLQFALWREAIHIVDSGYCDAETVDLIARETFGRRLPAMGPLENADYIGLDLTSQIMTYLLPTLARNQEPSDGLRELTRSGHTGARAGKGFLPWPDGRREDARRRLDQQLRRRTAPTDYQQGDE